MAKFGSVQDEIAAMEARLAELKSLRTPDSAKPAPARRRPVRDMLLDLLHDLGTPTYSREAAQLLHAIHDRRVPSARFGVLAIDEDKSFRSARTRTVYLGHALTAERFEPVKRLWIRSDWPLAERVIAPTTGRCRHLAMTARLCELAADGRTHAAHADILGYVAADHAADLPGVTVRRGQFEFELWADVARDSLTRLTEEDRGLREDAAVRLASLSDYRQLFGIPAVVSVNDTPGDASSADGPG